MDGYLTIGKVAKKLGLNPKTIRFYEEAGLIPSPQRRKGGWASAGQRIFAQRDIERLAFIKQARLLDLSLNQIKELLETVKEGCCSSARPHLRTLLESKLQEIDEKIEALNGLRRSLQRLHKITSQAELNQKNPTCVPASTDSECVFGESPVTPKSERR